jgi:microcompartment protein CcmL/EutN
MEKESLGLIETMGMVAALEAADAGAKAANVVLRGCQSARAGLITVVFTGDVASVRAAVSAGSAAATKIGTVVSVHVIARPDKQLRVYFGNGSTPTPKKIKEHTPAPEPLVAAPEAGIAVPLVESFKASVGEPSNGGAPVSGVIELDARGEAATAIAEEDEAVLEETEAKVEEVLDALPIAEATTFDEDLESIVEESEGGGGNEPSPEEVEAETEVSGVEVEVEAETEVELDVEDAVPVAATAGSLRKKKEKGKAKDKIRRTKNKKKA